MKLSSEILILVLMLLSNGRVLTLRKPHLDPLVMLAPLSFFLASLNLFAFRLDLFTLVIFFLSIVVLLSNFHALIRYSSGLVIDRYSPLMKTWAWLTTVLSTIMIIIVFIFRPVSFSEKKLPINESIYKYTGSFTKGFEPAGNFSTCTAFLHQFSPEDTSAHKNNIIIFMPDKRGDTENYKPLLCLLANEGYTVLSTDFYSKDCRWIHTIEDARMLRKFGLSLRGIYTEKKYNSQREFYTYNFSREFKAVLSMTKELDFYSPESHFFLVTDNMSYTAALDIKNEIPDLISGIYNISNSTEYKTPGYGFVQQTDPFIAKQLGYKRDKTFEAVKSCLSETLKAINTTFNSIEN